ncbi:hypothetical protein ACGFIY_33760 [Micromonospora chersina]|uniref:hypothetical protein n=1 Tax=Micromonospora chersina TaxID=47854 RepID=UPI0037223689
MRTERAMSRLPGKKRAWGLIVGVMTLSLGVASPALGIGFGGNNLATPPPTITLESDSCVTQNFGPNGRLLFVTCLTIYSGVQPHERFNLNARVVSNNPIGDGTRYWITRISLDDKEGNHREQCKGGWLEPGKIIQCTVQPPSGVTYARAYWNTTVDGTPQTVETTINPPF